MKSKTLKTCKMKQMKTYSTPQSVVRELVTVSLLAASTSITIDPTPGEYEGDANRKGWSAENWIDTED